MKVVIVDDERPARENLRTTLNHFFPDIQVVGEADSVVTAVNVLTEVEMDLVFLDVNLFDGSGFNILEELPEINFHVIFVTAYSQFAIRAFRVNALDYILKPVNVNELKQAVEKAMHSTENHQVRILKSALQLKENIFKSQRLAIKENDGIRFIEIPTIIRCKSDNNYTDIFLATGEKIVSSRTLKEYTQILESYDFLRIHQSHLVNTCKITKIHKKDGIYVEMDNGELLEVSRRKKEDLYRKMQM